MKNYCETGLPRVQLYVNENREWQKKLSLHSDELPRLEKMLQKVLPIVDLPGEEINNGDLALLDQLNKQRIRMKELNTELDMQQWRLENDTLHNPLHKLRLLCKQDILRECIKEVEKRYVDLKCTLLKYMPAVL